MFAPMRAVARDPEGKVLLLGAATMVAVGTVTYHVLEGWSFLHSPYFSVVTLATVGFGDLTPRPTSPSCSPWATSRSESASWRRSRPS